MARFKPLLVVGIILLVLALALGAYYEIGRSLIEARAAACSMNLGSIGGKVAEFRATRQRYPVSAAELVGVPPEMLVDIISGRPFVWAEQAPDETGTIVMPLVLQPAPFRDGPWPFGEMRRIALFSDGQVREYPGAPGAKGLR